MNIIEKIRIRERLEILRLGINLLLLGFVLALTYFFIFIVTKVQQLFINYDK